MKRNTFYPLLMIILVSCSAKQEKPAEPEVAPIIEKSITRVPNDTTECIEEEVDTTYIADESVVKEPIDLANEKIKHQFKTLSPKQVPNLMKAWYNVSKQYAETQNDAECDSIFNLIFRYCERGQGNGKEYFVLPTSISVHVHKKTAYKSGSYNDIYDKYKQKGESYSYVPHLKTNRKVLYQFSAVNDLLHIYVQGNKERRESIKQYVNLRKNYYGWQAEDYPQITDIYLFSNGTAFYYFSSEESHGLIFMPKGSEEITVETWFEDSIIDFDDEEYDDE